MPLTPKEILELAVQKGAFVDKDLIDPTIQMLDEAYKGLGVPRSSRRVAISRVRMEIESAKTADQAKRLANIQNLLETIQPIIRNK